MSNSVGSQHGNGGDPFTKKSKIQQKNNIKQSFKPVTESDEVLGWNNNADYLDTSSSTEIGDSAPFDEKCCGEKVEENVAMHNTDNQNSPEVGVNKRGDDKPFDKKPIKEGDDFDDDIDTDDDITTSNDIDTSNDMGNDFESDIDLDTTDDFDDETYEDEIDDDYESDSNIEERLDSIEDLINKIADKLDVDVFDDDKLYDDDSEDYNQEDDIDDYDTDDDDDYEVFESKNFKKAMMEDKLNYFGKHPAYRKKPVTLPTSNHQEMQDYYDVNDDSVKGEKPFGEKIGSSEPFEIDANDLEDAITESITRLMKKKI